MMTSAQAACKHHSSRMPRLTIMRIGIAIQATRMMMAIAIANIAATAIIAATASSVQHRRDACNAMELHRTLK